MLALCLGKEKHPSQIRANEETVAVLAVIPDKMERMLVFLTSNSPN